MRRLIAVLTAAAVALGLTFVFAGSASASLTSPAANAVLAGTVTLSDTGGKDNSSLLGFKHCGGNVHTTIQLLNSSNTVVFSQVWDGEGARSVTVDTHAFANGSYKVRGIDGNGANSGFLGTSCTTQNVTQDNAVTIKNVTSIAYTGATSAAQNTSVTVSAKLTDSNKQPSGVGGKTVTFTLSGGASVNATTDGNGNASATMSIAGPPRTATITAHFNGDTFYVGDTDAPTFVVTKDASKTTLAAPADVVHGQATQFTASVAALEGTGTPGGTIQFTVDGGNFGAPVTISGGSATSTSTNSLGTGNHTIGAVYSGDGNFSGSTASTVTQHVLKAPTTTTLTQDVNPTVHGQAVTFTATVAVPAPGAGSPTGGVQFTIDGNPSGTAVGLTGDHASLTISNLHADDNHTVRATYNGDGDFASSDSAEIVHAVDQAQTAVDLSTSDTSAVSGQPLTFTAHVAPTGDGAGDPSGTVKFFADGNQIGGPVPLVGGSATSDTTSLLVGTHHITATYSGDADFAGSSKSLDQDVAAAHTTTSIDSHPNPSVFGQPVTVHAEVNPVSPATGHPIGTVKFVVDGDVADAIFVDLDNGSADATLTGLAVGGHTVTAQYLSGDENFVPSTSSVLTQQVNKATTETEVTSSSSPSVFGQPVTFTATVSVTAPGAGSPSGMVSFTDGSRILGTVPVDSSTGEQASIVISDLSVGQHAVVATYTGDGSFLGSNGSVSQKVERAHTSTLVTASANPAQSGQPVAFTAQISPVAPGAGDPTGTVTFTVNGARLGNPVMVSGGQATSTTFATLSPGTYRIEATYTGDGNFLGSSGSLDEGAGLNVTKGATTMALDSAPNPVAYGAPVTFTSTVTASAPATGHPSGVVQFWEGGKLLGASGLAAAEGANTSKATFVSSTLSPGAHAISAVYVGNFNFDGATASTSQDVGTASSVTGITSSANPSTFGQDVTVTATVTGASGPPTGTVTFRDGTTVLGTATLSTVSGSQQASLVVSGLGGGDHALTAEYSGDESHAPSSSVPYTQQVNRAASAIHAETLITAHDGNLDVRVGIVKATLTGLDGAPLPGQTVLFTTTLPADHDVVPMCQAVTDAHGVATCVTPIQDTIVVALGAGYEATFTGNADYLPATDHGSQL